METNIIEILLVEDNLNDVELTLRALKKFNIVNNIFVVHDGAEALDYIFLKGKYTNRENTTKLKVIFLDLKLPKLSGLEVLKELKKHDHTRKIPVVVLTSSKLEPDIERCYELGVNSYVVKPVDFDNFMESIRQLGLYWLLINEPPKTI
jgi:two-component system, response regulator